MLKFIECLSEQLVPYVQYCIHVIFPPNQSAIHLGISENLLQAEVRKCTKLFLNESHSALYIYSSTIYITNNLHFL